MLVALVAATKEPLSILYNMDHRRRKFSFRFFKPCNDFRLILDFNVDDDDNDDNDDNVSSPTDVKTSKMQILSFLSRSRFHFK